MPSAPLLVLGGDIPGLVAVTPASAAAATFAYAMTADLGAVSGIQSAAYAINDNGQRLASSASASSSWQLVDEFTTSHPACYTPGGGTNDLAIDLNGNWSAPINIGASGLPTGVSVASTPVIDFYYWTLGGDTLSYGTAPIPAGWSNGTGPVRVVPQPDPQDYTLDAEGYVALAVSSGRQANSSFNITLWASDGTTTQTETVPVVIQASCKRHY